MSVTYRLRITGTSVRCCRSMFTALFKLKVRTRPKPCASRSRTFPQNLARFGQYSPPACLETYLQYMLIERWMDEEQTFVEKRHQLHQVAINRGHTRYQYREVGIFFLRCRCFEILHHGYCVLPSSCQGLKHIFEEVVVGILLFDLTDFSQSSRYRSVVMHLQDERHELPKQGLFVTIHPVHTEIREIRKGCQFLPH